MYNNILYLTIIQRAQVKIVKGYLLELKKHSFTDVAIISLNLEKNQLLKIHSKALHPTDFDETEGVNKLESLVQLCLSRNNLTTVEEDTFKHVTKLRVLLLANNRIITIGLHFFTGLTALETLNVSHNSIEMIENGTFHPLVKLNYLLFEYTRIPELWPGVFRIVICRRVHVWWVDNRELRCDCSLAWLRGFRIESLTNGTGILQFKCEHYPTKEMAVTECYLFQNSRLCRKLTNPSFDVECPNKAVTHTQRCDYVAPSTGTSYALLYAFVGVLLVLTLMVGIGVGYYVYDGRVRGQEGKVVERPQSQVKVGGDDFLTDMFNFITVS